MELRYHWVSPLCFSENHQEAQRVRDISLQMVNDRAEAEPSTDEPSAEDFSLPPCHAQLQTVTPALDKPSQGHSEGDDLPPS